MAQLVGCLSLTPTIWGSYHSMVKNKLDRFARWKAPSIKRFNKNMKSYNNIPGTERTSC